jgi:hypothetical protein
MGYAALAALDEAPARDRRRCSVRIGICGPWRQCDDLHCCGMLSPNCAATAERPFARNLASAVSQPIPDASVVEDVD